MIKEEGTHRIMDSQEREISYNGEVIAYTLQHKRVKNINLRVHLDGRVHVSASPYVPLYKVDAFVTEQVPFIKRAQYKFEQMTVKRGAPRQYVSGERTTLLGQPVTIQIECLGARRKSYGAFDGKGTLYLYVHNPDSKEERFKAFDSYLRNVGDRLFKHWSQQVYERFVEAGYTVPKAQLRQRRMTSRWGSCTPAKELITMNLRLLEGPESFIEYVMVHEYAHFIHLNHSQAFHSLVERFLPDWKERKKALNTYFYLHGQ